MKKQINKRKVYKVVDVANSGIMYSVSVPRSAAHCLRYSIGQWIKPKIEGSKIFVFDTLAHAKDFAGVGHSVFECEYTGKAIRPNYMCYDFEYMRKVSQFWQAYHGGEECIRSNNVSNTNMLPDGTLYVDAIRLVRKVCEGS